MIARLLALALALVAGSADANDPALPRHSAVPGGIAVVPLEGIGADTRPVAHFEDRRVAVLNSGGRWHAIVGLPLDVQPGELTLRVSAPQEKTIAFKVESKVYEEQRLTIKNKRMVEPTKKDLERIAKEGKIINAAFERFTEDVAASFDFIPPVKGVLSSPFGLRRFFNDQPRKPHSGLDFAAPKGTPIVAPAAGIVAAVGNYFFNGNNVIIDHGQGLVSMYSHLTRTYVKEGQKLQQGTKVGTVGATGRVTGPHLHWTVILNNARVDPLLFFNDQVLAQFSPKLDSEDNDAAGSE
jgi:murein DD-endopeptidase MepM/ murein hydrolase activator NlpD